MKIFDIETDGLLDTITTIHCLVITDVDTGEAQRFRSAPGAPGIKAGLDLLHAYAAAGEKVAGHNVIGFDIPAIRKVLGLAAFTIPEAQVLDTLVLGRLIFPDLWDQDKKLVARGVMPKKLMNRQSLEAWGVRLNCPKDNYTDWCKEQGIDPWAAWNLRMEDYCVQDCETTRKLLRMLLSKAPSADSVEVEHGVAWIICRQERFGFHFFAERAHKLHSRLVAAKEKMRGELQALFPPFFKFDKEFTPKRDDRKYGYTGGAPFSKLVLLDFNPASRAHICNRLASKYQWSPVEFTDTGDPKMDEAVLGQLPYPEAKALGEYMTICKRLGQVAEGDEAWLKRVGKDGRMHGRVNTNGAVTGRMTHSTPNMGQVPASYSPFGHECRACFGVPPGKWQVGADADALELRDLAGYMARHDDGAYIRTVLEGKKAEGTDMHSVNCRAIGLDPTKEYHTGESGRDIAKTWFYAFIYGAGDEKLGFIITRKKGSAAVRVGKASRAKFMANLPALGKLIDAVKKAVRERGSLRGLDGRVLKVRSQHSALNTLLQSAGAVQMKRGLVILDRGLQARGFVPGREYEFIANVHDEWQLECSTEEVAHDVGKAAVDAIRLAGEHYKFRCPLGGEYKVGKSWADCH